jgi:CheY-like chemotaxis protein
MGVAQSDTADRLDEAVLLSMVSDVRHGDFSVRMPLGWAGEAGKIAEAGERRRCIDAGGSAYVSKPVETDELLLALGEWLPAPVPAEAIDGTRDDR